MSKVEIITAIRALPPRERQALLNEFPERALDPIDLEHLREFEDNLKNAQPVPRSKWTEDMKQAADEAMLELHAAQPIEEFAADIRAGKYESSGL